MHTEKGEMKELEMLLKEFAGARSVHFVATGLDRLPWNTSYIQLEDLRHPGDASGYVNVDLDSTGAGSVTIYSGLSYHLHGSHGVSYGNDWCSNLFRVRQELSPWRCDS